MSKNNSGEVTKATLFSKLQTRVWPQVSAVVEKVADYMPKEDFKVRLIDPFEKTHNVGESTSEGGSKIAGIKVRMMPYRIPRNTTQTESALIRPVSGQSLRPISAQIRPKSSYSTLSSKSLARSSNEGKTKREQPRKQYVLETDEQGIVLFKQLPHDVYELEVIETKNFLPEKRVI